MSSSQSPTGTAGCLHQGCSCLCIADFKFPQLCCYPFTDSFLFRVVAVSIMKSGTFGCSELWSILWSWWFAIGSWLHQQLMFKWNPVGSGEDIQPVWVKIRMLHSWKWSTTIIKADMQSTWIQNHHLITIWRWNYRCWMILEHFRKKYHRCLLKPAVVSSNAFPFASKILLSSAVRLLDRRKGHLALEISHRTITGI